MPDKEDPIDSHNARQLDAAAAILVQLGRQAVEKNSFGTLTLKLEWRANVLIRRTFNEEHSTLTPTPGSA